MNRSKLFWTSRLNSVEFMFLFDKLLQNTKSGSLSKSVKLPVFVVHFENSIANKNEDWNEFKTLNCFILCFKKGSGKRMIKSDDWNHLKRLTIKENIIGRLWPRFDVASIRLKRWGLLSQMSISRGGDEMCREKGVFIFLWMLD